MGDRTKGFYKDFCGSAPPELGAGGLSEGWEASRSHVSRMHCNTKSKLFSISSL